jgi:hypothetical protein
VAYPERSGKEADFVAKFSLGFLKVGFKSLRLTEQNVRPSVVGAGFSDSAWTRYFGAPGGSVNFRGV